MDELNDKELTQVRLRFLDLIKSFFISSPDAERLSRWRGTFAALVKDQISPDVDQAVRALNTQLTEKKLEDLQDEYYALFIDPFSEDHLNLMASYHIDGRNYGDTLIAFRQYLFDSGIDVTHSGSDSEDSLAIMLDTLVTLIELEKNGEDTADKQRELLEDFLLPSVTHFSKAAARNSSAMFYEACISFCRGYLFLEKSLTA